MDRPRVCAAIIRKSQEILMVEHHASEGDRHWTLPGGAIEPGETAEEAVVREVFEETRLHGKVLHRLFIDRYSYGQESTYLVEVGDSPRAKLGEDPEERGRSHRTLSAIRWFPLEEVKGDRQVSKVIAALHGPSDR
jgi:ADP-ribose pyrophosphatase YjhB (NUDIX family)